MVETPKSSVNSELITQAYKPLVYILPRESSNLKQLVSTQIQAVEKEASKGYINTFLDTALVTALAIAYPPLGYSVLAGQLKRFKEIQKSTDDNSGNPQQQEMKNELKSYLERINLDINDWIEFIEEIPFSKIPQEIDFPPGHPLPRRLYRVHPLKKKSNRYIPVEVFDSLLYQERESELIKLLIDLGAVEITIKDLSSTKTKGGMSAKATASTVGGLETKAEAEREKSSSETRLIQLSQKSWDAEKFNEADYSWLAYEPAWEALVHARLIGKCLLSSVELNSDTSYSISANLGLTEGFIQQFADVGGDIEFSNLYKASKLFEVKFIDD